MAWNSSLTRTWYSKGCSLKRKYLDGVPANASSSVRTQIVFNKILSGCLKGKAVTRYAEDGLTLTAGYIKLGVNYPEVTRGLELLFQDRCGTIFAPPHAVRWSLLPAEKRDVCVACGLVISDHIDHVIFDCEEYEAERNNLFRNWSEASAFAEVPVIEGERRRGCLLGKTRSRTALITSWLAPRQQLEGDSSTLEASGSTNRSLPENESGSPGFVRVAMFYQHAIGDWQRRLWIKIRAYREKIGKPIPSCRRANAYDGPTDRHALSTSNPGRGFS